MEVDGVLEQPDSTSLRENQPLWDMSDEPEEAGETSSKHHFLREEDNLRPHLKQSKRNRKQPAYFTTNFGPASRWKDSHVAALAAKLESAEGFQDHEMDDMWTMLADHDVNNAYCHPKVFDKYNTFAAAKNKDEDSPYYVEAMTRPYE